MRRGRLGIRFRIGGVKCLLLRMSWGENQGELMNRSIDIERIDENIAARLARLEVRMQHVVTHQQAMWAVLAALVVPAFFMLLGSLVG